MAKKDSKAKKSPKKKDDMIRRRALMLRLAISGLVMVLIGVGVAVATHFILQSATRHGVRCVVPNLESLRLAEADSVILSNDLKLVINDSLYAPTFERGTVLVQLPEAGTVVKPGRTIYVTINATQQKMVEIPYVAGRSLRQAKNMLDVAGLTISRLIYQRDLATNYILSQSYNGDQIGANSSKKAPVGSGITLTVGVSEDGDESITPQLVGQSLYSAKSALWSAGLNVGAVKFGDDVDMNSVKLAYVISQSIPADSVLNLGREVSLELTLDEGRVAQYFKNQDIVRRLEEQMAELDQALIDSMAVFMPEEVVVEEEKPKVERVDFEDLFN